jgi:hypothetical protein
MLRGEGAPLLQGQIFAVLDGGGDAKTLAAGLGFYPNHSGVITNPTPTIKVEFRRQNHFHLDRRSVGKFVTAEDEQAAAVQIGNLSLF